MSDIAHVDVDALVDELRSRVAARRASGDYPPGLEEQLESEFRLIMAAVHRDEVGTGELGRRVAMVQQSTAAIRSDPDLRSRLPGGTLAHHVAAKVVRRHTGTLADSVRVLGTDVHAALQELHRLMDVQRNADHRQLNEVLASLMDRLAVVDHLADAVVDLEARVAALEAGS